eukprot:66313-Pyramimonas_sp.AAC.2
MTKAVAYYKDTMVGVAKSPAPRFILEDARVPAGTTEETDLTLDGEDYVLYEGEDHTPPDSSKPGLEPPGRMSKSKRVRRPGGERMPGAGANRARGESICPEREPIARGCPPL